MRELTVTFVTGRAYVYFEVEPETVSAFSDADSKGRFFNAHIRDWYDYKELLR